MVAIVCTIIICVTVLLCVDKICKLAIQKPDTQQPVITNEDLEMAYKEAETDKMPDFQDVLEAINKEIAGIAEDDNE